MSLETGTYISDLVATNPAEADDPGQGNDHFWLLKTVLKGTFTGGATGLAGAVTATHTELNYCVGLTSAAQTQLTALTSVVQNTQNANYTLVLTDANKQIYKSNGTAYAWTVPANATKAFPVGTTILLINNGTAGAITITRDTDVVLRLAGSGTDANYTLAARGVATIIKVGTNEWYVSGAGLS